jgi:oxygen-independent coproporphyrinogen-3 oxidase
METSTQQASSTPTPSLGIYIHLPYCVKKCPYCDFNSYALKNGSKSIETDTETVYIDATCQELKQYSETITANCHSIFIGGGTPSLFSPGSIEKLITTCDSYFPLLKEAEVSLECNPGTVFETLGKNKLSAFRQSGVNRISVGAQSFSAKKLQQLGRIHSPEDTQSAVKNILSAGFENFNLDLMFGISGENQEQWQNDLTIAANLNPQHISAYALTIEPGTEFYRRERSGEKVTVEDDTSGRFYELSKEILATHGYNRYEISNYAKDAHECQHNLGYWQRKDYLGIGAGAHGFTGEQSLGPWGFRWWNIPGPDD